MQSNKSWKFSAGWWMSRCCVGVAAYAAMAVTVGCAHVNNPWWDSSDSVDADMTTPSAGFYREERAEFASMPQRQWPESEYEIVNCSVTHWPLWFEDPFEDKGNRLVTPADRDAPDNSFAVTWVDYLHMGYGPGRMLLNIAGFPISAIIEPPGTLMESDGRIDKNILGYDHDAKRSDSTTREPPDVHHLDRKPFVDLNDESTTATSTTAP